MRRLATVVGLTGLLLAAVSAQDRPHGDAQARAASGSAVIRGRVIAADTGLPIRDAVVALMETKPGGSAVVIISGIGRESIDRAPLDGTLVDADGRFEFTNVAPGKYVLMTRPGPGAARYLPQRYPDPQSDTAEPLEATNGRVVQLTIALPRAGAINGRVYDERGDPLAFAQMSLVELLPGGRQRPSGIGGVLSAAMGHHAMTDDNGAFRLFSLPPGQYLVFAVSSRTTGVLARAVMMSPGRVPVYYPGTPNASEAVPVSVTAGGEASIEFAVPSVRTYTVSGTVIDPTGATVPNVNVVLRPGVDNVLSSAVERAAAGDARGTGPDGTFSIPGVVPGARMLTVVRRGVMSAGVPRVEYARVPLSIEHDTSIAVQLRSSATVEGTVILEDGELENERVHVRYVPLGDQGTDGSGSMQIRADRSFTLEHLIGPMFVRSSATRWHLKSVLYGQEDITDTPIEFRAGDQRQLTLTLSRQLGVVSGAATTAGGKEIDARIVLFSADRSLWNDRYSTTKTALTASDGKFKIEGVRAGRYLAVAISLDEGETANAPPAFYDLLAKTAVAISVADGQSQTVNLKLSRLR